MQPSVRKKSWMNRFIDTIEYWEINCPILLSFWDARRHYPYWVLDLIPGWLQHNLYGSFTNPRGTGKEVTIAVTNLLSGENLRYLITKYPDIFIGYPPMKLVLVMMAATAFIEKTGFFGTL